MKNVKWKTEYTQKISKDTIALMELRGNEIFEVGFNEDVEAVYKYCVEHGQKWEEVLKVSTGKDYIY